MTLIAATELLEGHSQAAFNQMVLRLELEEQIPPDTRISVQKKCAQLGRIVVRHATMPLETLEGRTLLGKAVVQEAVAIARRESRWRQQIRFMQALARDGYSLIWDADGTAELVPAFPVELAKETGDELHQLLAEHGFGTARNHLDQALRAHGRGDWAAANAQFRTFLEALLSDIAAALEPSSSNARTPENKRALLARVDFLSMERNEWTEDGKNFLNGLTKLLSTEGSHQGLSDSEHSTFRLHLVLVTGRTLLRRLADRRNVDRSP